MTTRGSAVTRETFGFSLDAFNNRTQACVYNGSPGTVVRCVDATYVTSAAYTTLNVHLRGRPATEVTSGYRNGSLQTDAQRQWNYDTYSGDSGALGNRSGITGHDAAWGTYAFVTRVVDPMGQQSTARYQYWLGALSQVTDPNCGLRAMKIIIPSS